MKKKILVPMFASVVALSMNSIANADEIENKEIENKEKSASTTIDLGEFKDITYKVATVKEGVAVKVREQGSVQHIAYTGDEFKVLGTQGDWVKVSVADGEGWIPSRFVDMKEANGYTTEHKVNFRKEANTEAKVVEELEIGSSVKVLEDNGSWMKVKKGEEEGYIRSLYVADKAPVIEVEKAPVVEAEKTPVVENTDNNQAVDNNVDSNNDVDQNNDDQTVNNNENSNDNQTSNNEQNNNTSSNNNNNSNNNNSNNNNSNNNSNNNNNGGETQKPVEKPSEGEDSNNPPTSNTSAAQAIVNLAYAKLGSPYVWGAEGPNSFDCSGLTSYVYRNAAGVNLPRTSGSQAGYGQTVSKSNLKAGDLVFFSTNGTGSVSHVGIYIGGGNMIHAPKPGDSVKITNINSSYYVSAFVTAKRVI